MKRIGRVFPRKGYFDSYVVGRVRAWWWRYWPDRCQLMASCKIGKCSPADAVLLLLAVERSIVAKRISMSPAGLPSKEPLALRGFWEKELPELASFMVDSHYDDGSPRQAGKLFIAIQNGMWVATLKDPNQGLELSVMVVAPEQIMQALDAALSSTAPPWRVDQWAAGRSKKVKK